MKSAFTVYFIIIVYSFDFSFGIQLVDDMNVANLSAIEIIEKYGYPSEVHHVETEDGFILELHRIPFGKYSHEKKPGYPILLEQGMIASSTEFLLLGSQSLPFYLADEGYDVWLGNVRGNSYSSHKYYTEDDKEFWDFSFHEMGVYDAPAQIIYICNQTQHEDIIYLGYSMGSTMYFVMASERPEFQKKIRAAIILAPVAYVKHSDSPSRYLAGYFASFSAWSAKKVLFDRSSAQEKFIENACIENSSPINICKDLLFYTFGKDSEQLTHEILGNVVTHIPDRTSAKTIVHYSQMLISGTFRQFDYGIIGNKKKYNSSSPPDYNLSATITPLHIFLGAKDFFSTPEDLERAFSELPNIKTVYIVPYKTFTHLDFVIAKDAKTLLYDKIIERVKEILQDVEYKQE